MGKLGNELGSKARRNAPLLLSRIVLARPRLNDGKPEVCFGILGIELHGMLELAERSRQVPFG